MENDKKSFPDLVYIMQIPTADDLHVYKSCNGLAMWADRKDNRVAVYKLVQVSSIVANVTFDPPLKHEDL